MKKKTILITIITLFVLLALAVGAYFLISSNAKINGSGDGESSGEDLYVYDENGETETDPDTGLPYVYQTDSDGYISTDENGEPMTVISGYDIYNNSTGENENPSVPLNDMGESGTVDANGETTKENNLSNDPETDANGDVIGVVTLPN